MCVCVVVRVIGCSVASKALPNNLIVRGLEVWLTKAEPRQVNLRSRDRGAGVGLALCANTWQQSAASLDRFTNWSNLFGEKHERWMASEAEGDGRSECRSIAFSFFRGASLYKTRSSWEYIFTPKETEK